MSRPHRLGLVEAVRGSLLVARKELATAFDSNIAIVYTVAFVLLSNSIFMNEFFLAGRLSMDAYFELLPYLLAVFLPAITMRLWAEERKHRTLELLLTLPLQPSQCVAGKYLAALGLYGVFLLGSTPIVWMLMDLGEPDLWRVACGYLALGCFGALFLAFGLALSALSADQIIALVGASLLGLALVLLGEPRAIAVLDGWAPSWSLGSKLADSFSVMPHYHELRRGFVSLSSGLFFAGWSLFFLILNANILRGQRT